MKLEFAELVISKETTSTKQVKIERILKKLIYRRPLAALCRRHQFYANERIGYDEVRQIL